MKLKIGNVKIDNQVVLAPMAGICDSAFRSIIKSMGCGLLCTEMVSDKAVIYTNKRTHEMLYMTDYERPISQQIFGNNPETLKTASQYIIDYMNPNIIDINMGCPVVKVAEKSKAGSALLKDPEKAGKIVESVVNNVDIPVTVKIRSGWDRNSVNACEIAEIVENSGASAITVHPRTRDQRYGEPSDWSIIKEVKDILSIPVIGNGDVKSCYDAREMLDYTGCDAVMIGRGVLGNPWLVRDCVNYLQSGEKPTAVSVDEKVSMIKKHTELLMEIRSESYAVKKMRTHAAYYVKGLFKSIEFKPKLFKTNTKDELFKLIDDYADSIRR